MRILVLGGTIFLGRHIVKRALQEGHEVTIFHRGNHGKNLFPKIQKIYGDRRKDLKKIPSQYWDAVIDTSGYFPEDVEKSIAELRDDAERYVFISSASVYRDFKKEGIDENYPLLELKDDHNFQVTNENYGALKALCEEKVRNHYPRRHLIVRAGLIVGPHDPSDRFSYWPYRIKKGGNFIAPGSPENEVQFIDVRDLAEWILYSLENGISGTYNTNGFEETLTMDDFLHKCIETLNHNAVPVWMNDEFLMKEKIMPFAELPLWLPKTEFTKGFNKISSAKAYKNGLKLRPVEATIEDTYRWLESEVIDKRSLVAGLHQVKEDRLLNLWRI